MQCRECQEDVTAWLDGELAGDRCHQIDLHVQQCPDCRGVLQEHRRDREWLQAQDRPLTLPAGLWRRIEQDLSRPIPSPAHRLLTRWQQLLPKWSLELPQALWAGSAVALLLVFGGFLVLRQVDPQPDAQILQMMQQYVDWREQQEHLYHPSAGDSRPQADDLKSINPFLQETAVNADANPFKI